MTEERRREVVAELLQAMGLPPLEDGTAKGAAFSANPVLESHVGRIAPPHYDFQSLVVRIRRVLAQAVQPLSAEATAGLIVRADGGVLLDDSLPRLVGSILRQWPRMAVDTGRGWWLPKRGHPPAPQMTPQTKRQDAGSPGRLLRPDEPGYREQQSRIAQEAWRRRDYMAPPRKGEPGG
ncbi:MAG TPA: hypothetical protein VH575_12490 [Gemmataceae bacterium]|jgi:hypothetical protein